MNLTEKQMGIIKQAKLMFPDGPKNYTDEKRLKDILDRYEIPYTNESINQVLKINIDEELKKYQEHRQEA